MVLVEQNPRAVLGVELAQKIVYGYEPTPADLDEPVAAEAYQDQRA